MDLFHNKWLCPWLSVPLWKGKSLFTPLVKENKTVCQQFMCLLKDFPALLGVTWVWNLNASTTVITKDVVYVSCYTHAAHAVQQQAVERYSIKLLLCLRLRSTSELHYFTSYCTSTWLEFFYIVLLYTSFLLHVRGKYCTFTTLH